MRYTHTLSEIPLRAALVTMAIFFSPFINLSRSRVLIISKGISVSDRDSYKIYSDQLDQLYNQLESI